MSNNIIYGINVMRSHTLHGLLTMDIEHDDSILMCIELHPTRADFARLATALRAALTTVSTTSHDCGTCTLIAYGDGHAEIKISAKKPRTVALARARLTQQQASALADKIDGALASTESAEANRSAA